MTYKKTALFIALLPFTLLPNTKQTKIINSFYASAYGDALGRVTEFIPSTEGIFKKYPEGVRSVDDFTKDEWEGIPEIYKLSKKAPYTDDTAMALLVAEVLIQAKKEQWNLNKTMSEIAYAFIKDKANTTYGWAAYFRAPGNACLNGVLTLEQKLSGDLPVSWLDSWFGNWWDVNASQAGGCGSVMRAFTFGLVFHDNLEKAKLWAVEHSKLTHGHPISLAACAAMAVGTAQCLNTPIWLATLKTMDMDGNTIVMPTNIKRIINSMVSAALEYDTETAQKMRTAEIYATEAKVLLKGRSIEQALNDATFRAFHDKVFAQFPGWAAHDAIAATVYVFSLFPEDIESALYVAVHTPGDSDSIAAMAGALVGAYSHTSSIKESWKTAIEDSERIYSLASAIPC